MNVLLHLQSSILTLSTGKNLCSCFQRFFLLKIPTLSKFIHANVDVSTLNYSRELVTENIAFVQFEIISQSRAVSLIISFKKLGN
jgi:hypothetical protein